MKIIRLTMHNFGVYASTNTLEFKKNKPVVLIGGMNGRGKTTILEAVLLGLYGSKSFAYTESKYVTYGQYLKSYVNKADGTLKSYVEIEFSIGKEEVYCVRREWNGNGKRVRETILVEKNGEKNTFLTENWPMFVENILPSALSNFFFFDGEKIAELAVEDTSEQMKESIKAMLGITVLDVLESDIKKIVSKISKKTSDKQDMYKLEQLRKIKEKAEKTLIEVDIDIDNERILLQQMQTELEKLNIKYSEKGGGILEKKKQLMKDRSESLAVVTSSQNQLLELAAGELPLMLVKDLLEDIQKKGKDEHEHKINLIALDKITESYKRFNEKSEYINKFINFMKSEINENEDDEIYGLSDASLYQIEKLNNFDLRQSIDRAKKIFAIRDVHKGKVYEIDSSLSVDIDENKLNEIVEKIRKKECDIATKKTKIDNLEKNRSTIHGKLLTAESEFSKYAESILSVLESADSDERVLKYSHIATEIIKRYRVRLQERKVSVLAETMTGCYKRLANKKNLVDSIKMDPETLDLYYIDNEGEKIAKKRLSAGEKQLMVISLLWALAICSEKKLPVIIDTPLSRLDMSHRRALIKTYFPNASEQTIILSTDSEIDETNYVLIKQSVGDKYTLKYNDKTRNTIIKSGYFGWEE